MKFTKVFRGVPDGEIYPVTYQPGDVCPPELAHAATEAGALAADEQAAPQPVEEPGFAAEPDMSAGPAVEPDAVEPAPPKTGKSKK